MPVTEYNKCRNMVIESHMKSYEKGKLKSRSGKKVTSQKQAIAMSLSIADNKCEKKMGKVDLEEIKEKVESFMKENMKNKQILKKSDLKRFKEYIKMNKKKNEMIKALKAENFILRRLLETKCIKNLDEFTIEQIDFD
jgi:hypothetical protein